MENKKGKKDPKKRLPWRRGRPKEGEEISPIP